VSPERLSPCPLCGTFGLYTREVRQGGNLYVLDCANCRRLLIPGLFFTALWDMKEPQRRALGRLLAENALKYGPSLVLDTDRCRTLLSDLQTSEEVIKAKPGRGE
jgi:hypothetical protein